MLFLSSSVSRPLVNNKKGVIFNIGICTTPLTSKSWQLKFGFKKSGFVLMDNDFQELFT